MCSERLCFLAARSFFFSATSPSRFVQHATVIRKCDIEIQNPLKRTRCSRCVSISKLVQTSLHDFPSTDFSGVRDERMIASPDLGSSVPSLPIVLLVLSPFLKWLHLPENKRCSNCVSLVFSRYIFLVPWMFQALPPLNLVSFVALCFRSQRYSRGFSLRPYVLSPT